MRGIEKIQSYGRGVEVEGGMRCSSGAWISNYEVEIGFAPMRTPQSKQDRVEGRRFNEIIPELL